MKTNVATKNTGSVKTFNSPFFTRKNEDSFFGSSNYFNIQSKTSDDSNTKVQMQVEEEEEPVQTKMLGDADFQEEVQSKIDVQFMEEEEEEIQPKSDSDTQVTSVHKIARSGFLGSSGQYPFFHQIQHSFGNHNISSIQAYSNSGATKANREMGAMAYTVGNKVAFKNSPSLHTAAHEAAHVIQQQKGVSLKSGVGQKGDVYEQHADAVADRVVQGKSAQNLLSQTPDSDSQSSGEPIQFEISNAGSDLGVYWDAYVNPGNRPAASQGIRDSGHQVRSFQRLLNRSTHSEEGNRVVDVNDRGITAGQTLSDSEQIGEPATAGPRQWDITLLSHELFDPQPELADVIQGSIGDCYLLATLQSMSSRAGSRTQLTNAVNETDTGYSVEFFRPQIIGTQALIDPNTKVRVNIGQGYNPRGVQLREKNGVMSDADARQLVAESAYASQLQEGDSFNVSWTKRIIWPWAIERAYASVCGGFNRIEGGFSALPMMVLTGEVPNHIFNFSGVTDAQLASALNALNGMLDNDSLITAATIANLDTIYNRTFFVVAADRSNGLRFSGVDGVLTGWIPWNEIHQNMSGYTILDPLGPLSGRPMITSHADYSDHLQALVDATSRSGVIISGTFNTVCLGQGLILAPSHEYSVTAVSSAGAQTLNPWARLHPGLVSPAQLKRAYGRLTIKA